MPDDYFGYNPYGRDHQDDYNWNAAYQNDAVRQQRYAEDPAPDPRQLAAQSMVRRYGAQTPSYSNVNGHYAVNGQPVDTNEQGAQMQFEQAKRRAAQDMLDRRSGNYAAGTSGRTMLQDPQFLGMPQQTQDAVYQGAYGNSIAEDQQADQMGGHMTMQQMRFRNTMPDRQKADKEWFASTEGFTGANFSDIASNYDRASGVARIPGRWVKSQDQFGNETMVQQPARELHIPSQLVDEGQRRTAHFAGMEQFPQQPMQAQQTTGQQVASSINRMPGFAPVNADPSRDAKLHEVNQTLRRNGIVLLPDELHEVVKRAILSGMGAPVTEEHVLMAAQALQDEQRQHTQHLYNARAGFAGPSYIPTGGPNYR